MMNFKKDLNLSYLEQIQESPAKENLTKKFFAEYTEFILRNPDKKIKTASAKDKIRLEELMDDKGFKKFLQLAEDPEGYIFTTLNSTEWFFKSEEKICDTISMLKRYHAQPCTSFAAGEIERRKILETWKQLTCEVFPDLERAADSEKVDSTEKVNKVVEAFKQECLQYLQAQKENYPGQTETAVKTWSEVEELMESYFKKFQQRKQVEASEKIHQRRKKMMIAATSVSAAITVAFTSGVAAAAISPVIAAEVVAGGVVGGLVAETGAVARIINLARYAAWR